jgi:chemotaxis protein MotB
MSHPGGKKRRKGGHDEAEHPDERWLVTYADMVTLLMVLFIVMFSISQVDEKKFAALSGGLAESFGSPVRILDSGKGLLADDAISPASVEVGPELKTRPEKGAAASTKARERSEAILAEAAANQEFQDLLKARKKMTEALRKKGLDKKVRFRLDEQGLVVSVVTDKVLFPADLADLQPGGRQVLDALVPALRGLRNNLVVTGHTNTAPVRPRFYPTEWELSTARAVSVLRYLAERHRLAERRLSASGFAEQRPLYGADNPRADELNRRVEIIVVPRNALTRKKLTPQPVSKEPVAAAPAGHAPAPAPAPAGHDGGH